MTKELDEYYDYPRHTKSWQVSENYLIYLRSQDRSLMAQAMIRCVSRVIDQELRAINFYTEHDIVVSVRFFATSTENYLKGSILRKIYRNVLQP